MNHRSRRNKRRATHVSSEILECRALLAGIVDSIQIDDQAPVVLPDVNGQELLALSDEDSTRLMTTDGTQGGTVEFADIPVVLTEKTTGQLVVGNTLFFSAQGADGAELWRTDGTGPGTFLVQQGISPAFDDYAVLNGEILFQAESDHTIGSELYKSDGGPATLVRDINPGLESTSIYMGTDRGAHMELWINEIDPVDSTLIRSRVIHEFNVPNDLYYRVTVPRGRYRYWTRPTDAQGNEGNWSSSRDFTAHASPFDSAPSSLTVFNNEVYFAAATQEHGKELWKTDGTFDGTTQVADIVQDSFNRGSEPSTFVEFDGELFFRAGRFSADTLYRTDGTAGGTTRVGDDTDATLPVATVNGQLLAVQQVDEEVRLLSFDSADDAEPDVVYTIPEFGGRDYWFNSLTGFSIVEDSLYFLSVEFESSVSAGLTPSEDRHFPSSVPRNFITKRGTWYSTDGTASGTSSVPGDTLILRENDVIQSRTNASLHDVMPFGTYQILSANGTWQLTDSIVRRLSAFGSATAGNELFTRGDSDSVIALDLTGRAEQLNLELSNVQTVDEIAGSAWVAADNGNGTALLKIDTSVDSVAGPVIAEPSDRSVHPAGDVWFEWNPVNGATSYDVILRQSDFEFEAIHNPRVSLDATQDLRFSEDLPAGRYRFQVRANFADTSSSRWSQSFISVTAPTRSGPQVVDPKAGDHFLGEAEVTWLADPDAVSYDIRVNNSNSPEPTIRGIVGTTASVLPQTADGRFANNVVYVRSRYGDGSVSQWSPSEAFLATPPFEITGVEPGDGPREFDVQVVADPVHRNGGYMLFDAATGDRVADRPDGFAVPANWTYRRIEVPYTGQFRIEAYNKGTNNQRALNLKSETTSFVFDVVIPFADSMPAVVDAIDAGEFLDLYWLGPDEAVSYDIELENGTTYTSVIGNHLRIERSLAGTQNGVWVTAVDGAGNRSVRAGGSFTRNRAPLELTAGDGTHITSQPTLRWNTPNPRYPDVVRYELLITSVSGTDSYRRTNITSPEHRLEVPLANGSWKIYIRAHFADNTRSAWVLPAGTMQIATPTQDPPVITSPGRTTTDVRPYIEWEENPAASHFEVWLSTSDAIAPIVYDASVQENRLILTEDLGPGSFRLWVKAHYPNGSSTRWTSTYRFDILINEVVQITDGDGVQQAGNHTITWAPVANADSYEMYINVRGRRSVSVYHETNLTGTSHTIPVNLAADQYYEIWMRAHFASGARSRWGTVPAELFVVADLSQVTPVLRLNGNRAEWDEIAGAFEYELWVDEIDPNNNNSRIRLRAFWIRTAATAVDMDLTDGTYRIWLSALSATGNRSNWTDGHIHVIS